MKNSTHFFLSELKKAIILQLRTNEHVNVSELYAYLFFCTHLRILSERQMLWKFSSRMQYVQVNSFNQSQFFTLRMILRTGKIVSLNFRKTLNRMHKVQSEYIKRGIHSEVYYGHNKLWSVIITNTRVKDTHIRKEHKRETQQRVRIDWSIE